ncbi:MAG: UDP-2,3-diacylglucosamine diphosphatase LpxI [Candidatus Omnitrophica bacterium]|nr:UDP-2,3-diacylglucosamine diphosphatase LpxI [Candidatus Omnitrophota bacterium]
MKKIGLIAGNRKFPLIVAEAAKHRGYHIVAIAIKKDTSREIGRFADIVYWLGLDEFSRMFDIFKQEGIKQAIMAGQISPRRLFSKEVMKSDVLRQILNGLKDKKADTIFAAIAQKLQEYGIELLSSITFVEDIMPKKGTLTRIEPDYQTKEDIYFGLETAKAIAALDIGQTVAVKDKVVLGIEAFEGTDGLIRRCAKLSHGSMTVVKVSKPRQDLRFDIPVVGLATVKNLVKARARCLAIEAGKTLFIDKEKALTLAERKDICVVAV